MYLNNKQNMTMMKPIDDYEISMHEYTIDEAPEEETPTSSKKKQNGYQRIEDWNKDDTNGKEVLARLKQEKALWASKFDSLGGDSI